MYIRIIKRVYPPLNIYICFLLLLLLLSTSKHKVKKYDIAHHAHTNSLCYYKKYTTVFQTYWVTLHSTRAFIINQVISLWSTTTPSKLAFWKLSLHTQLCPQALLQSGEVGYILPIAQNGKVRLSWSGPCKDPRQDPQCSSPPSPRSGGWSWYPSRAPWPIWLHELPRSLSQSGLLSKEERCRLGRASKGVGWGGNKKHKGLLNSWLQSTECALWDQISIDLLLIMSTTASRLQGHPIVTNGIGLPAKCSVRTKFNTCI